MKLLADTEKNYFRTNNEDEWCRFNWYLIDLNVISDNKKCLAYFVKLSINIQQQMEIAGSCFIAWNVAQTIQFIMRLCSLREIAV